jgi:hypothetical protein
LWRTVVDAYGLREDETQALEAACRQLDDLTRLEAALRTAPAMVLGSKGQERVNPLFSETRAARLALVKLLRATGLGEEETTDALSRQNAARRLARQRWRR